MNLAEFPLTVLSTRSNQSLKTLEFKDTIRTRKGELVTRSWIITGADKFGLPTSSDDEVLLGLLKLTVSSDFTDRKVLFSRYELLKTLRWSTEGRSYSRLTKALDRLSGVRIKATNAFYDNDSKAHSTRNFGIIDAYEINDGRNTDPKPSYFIWSETLFRSFKVGFIKKLDLDFYLNLRGAVAKRLYRYLDKHFWYRARVQINLFTLAHEKVGVSRSYRHVSSIRQQLDPAFEELIASGFVDRVEYSGRSTAAEVTIFAGRRSRALPSHQGGTTTEATECKDTLSRGDSADLLRSSVQAMLIERGLREAQVTRLLAGQTTELLERITRIVEHFDRLFAAKSHLVSRSPLGFLYRAVEHPEQFMLPGDSPQHTPQQTLIGLRERANKERRTKVERAEAKRDHAEDLESRYLIERRQEISRIRERAEEALIEKIRAEVDSKMIRLKEVITLERYREAVDHAVDEKLLRLFAFPEFREWAAHYRGGRGGSSIESAEDEEEVF